jgi:hypothetical protein
MDVTILVMENSCTAAGQPRHHHCIRLTRVGSHGALARIVDHLVALAVIVDDLVAVRDAKKKAGNLPSPAVSVRMASSAAAPSAVICAPCIVDSSRSRSRGNEEGRIRHAGNYKFQYSLFLGQGMAVSTRLYVLW